MSKTIDILTVVDCVSLMNAVANKTITAGTQSAPTSLGSYASSDAYIYMITASSYVVNDQAKSELTVSANVGDSVRWMITCPGGGTVTLSLNWEGFAEVWECRGTGRNRNRPEIRTCPPFQRTIKPRLNRVWRPEAHPSTASANTPLPKSQTTWASAAVSGGSPAA